MKVWPTYPPAKRAAESGWINVAQRQRVECVPALQVPLTMQPVNAVRAHSHAMPPLATAHMGDQHKRVAEVNAALREVEGQFMLLAKQQERFPQPDPVIV